MASASASPRTTRELLDALTAHLSLYNAANPSPAASSSSSPSTSPRAAILRWLGSLPPAAAATSLLSPSAATALLSMLRRLRLRGHYSFVLHSPSSREDEPTVLSRLKALFAVLYFFSFVLDGVDGWFARKFNQASTFGAVLDMVTDRVSTACLLALLSQFYRPGLVFLMLLGLDITSHWFQMYSSFLSGKTSHKDVKHTGNWLLKLYYGYRPFMAFCCVSCEVLYIILFLFADEKSTSLLSVCGGVLNKSPLIVLVFISTLVGWAVKQITNVIQMKTAADACVMYDLKRSK